MIYIAGDKHGYSAIEFVIEYLNEHEIEYVNLGVTSLSEDMKLEDMIPPVVKKVLDDDSNIGILSCGTGIGIEVGVNKFSGIRACLADNKQIAEWARVYDKCNVLCLVGWNSDRQRVYEILDSWFSARYDGDEARLEMFDRFNEWH